MNQITKVFEGNEVRILEIEGNPWFVAKDVALILGYQNAPRMTRNLEDDEKLMTTMWLAGQNRETTLTHEQLMK